MSWWNDIASTVKTAASVGAEFLESTDTSASELVAKKLYRAADDVSSSDGMTGVYGYKCTLPQTYVTK